MAEDRPTTRLGDIVFEFEHPQMDSSGSGNKVEHKVLPETEADPKSTVIQPMGREAFKWTMRGDCYRDTATALDELTGDVVDLRHARHSGEVYVDDVSTNPQGVEDDNGRRYSYTVKLIEVT